MLAHKKMQCRSVLNVSLQMHYVLGIVYCIAPEVSLSLLLLLFIQPWRAYPEYIRPTGRPFFARLVFTLHKRAPPIDLLVTFLENW